MATRDEQLERAIDRRVQVRLATDGAYLRAEDAESQTLREEQVTRAVERELRTERGRACRRRAARLEEYAAALRADGDSQEAGEAEAAALDWIAEAEQVELGVGEEAWG